jgi:hypothetical protein
LHDNIEVWENKVTGGVQDFSFLHNFDVSFKVRSWVFLGSSKVAAHGPFLIKD